jgi:hypothetical protein
LLPFYRKKNWNHWVAKSLSGQATRVLRAQTCFHGWSSSSLGAKPALELLCLPHASILEFLQHAWRFQWSLERLYNLYTFRSTCQRQACSQHILSSLLPWLKRLTE